MDSAPTYLAAIFLFTILITSNVIIAIALVFIVYSLDSYDLI